MAIASQYIRGRKVRVSEVGRSGALMYSVEAIVSNPPLETSAETFTAPTKEATAISTAYATLVEAYVPPEAEETASISTTYTTSVV